MGSSTELNALKDAIIQRDLLKFAFKNLRNPANLWIKCRSKICNLRSEITGVAALSDLGVK